MQCFRFKYCFFAKTSVIKETLVCFCFTDRQLSKKAQEAVDLFILAFPRAHTEEKASNLLEIFLSLNITALVWSEMTVTVT